MSRTWKPKHWNKLDPAQQAAYRKEHADEIAAWLAADGRRKRRTVDVLSGLAQRLIALAIAQLPGATGEERFAWCLRMLTLGADQVLAFDRLANAGGPPWLGVAGKLAEAGTDLALRSPLGQHLLAGLLQRAWDELAATDPNGGSLLGAIEAETAGLLRRHRMPPPDHAAVEREVLPELVRQLLDEYGAGEQVDRPPEIAPRKRVKDAPPEVPPAPKGAGTAPTPPGGEGEGEGSP